MPGITGFTKGTGNRKRMMNVAADMQDFMTHKPFYVKEPVFEDEYVCAARSFIGVAQKERQPYVSDDVYIWFDGEMYNQREPAGDTTRTDPQIVCEQYRTNKNWSFLKKYQGFFSAVVYDKKQKKIHLISDRYGFRHLYWTVSGGRLVWGSELKVFILVPGFSPLFDTDAIGEFLTIGHIIGDHTFIQNVEMLSASTALTYDLADSSVVRQRYWWWDEIKSPERSELTNDELLELGKLFIKGVERRVRPDERIGITLSGGLDSRAILAAIPEGHKHLHALTFGKEGSADVIIARKIAKMKGAVHHIVHLDTANWFYPRLKGIWYTDGHSNLLEMHGMVEEFKDRDYIDIFLGGAGGGLVGQHRMFEIETADYYIYKKYPKLKTKRDIADKLFNYIYNLGHSHIFHVDFFMKNTTMYGLRLGLTDGTERRMPLMDNDFQESVFTVSVNERKRNYMYERMLLINFPKYYKKIPRQSTGLTIGPPTIKKKILARLMKYKKNTKSFASKFGFKVKIDKKYIADYPNWLRSEEVSSFIKETLDSPDARYADLVPKEDAITLYDKHMAGEDVSVELARYVTLEVWLRQLLDGKYRP
jgi:asparagine synthase (glutamine-hydrolysing)